MRGRIPYYPDGVEAELAHPPLLTRLDMQVQLVEAGAGDPETVVTLCVRFLEALCNDLTGYMESEIGGFVPTLRDSLLPTKTESRRMNVADRLTHLATALEFQGEKEWNELQPHIKALVAVRNRFTHPQINAGERYGTPRILPLRAWPKEVRSLVSLGVIPHPRNVRSTLCHHLLACSEVALWAAEVALHSAALAMSMLPGGIVGQHFSVGFTSYLLEGNTKSDLFAERAFGVEPFSWSL